MNELNFYEINQWGLPDWIDGDGENPLMSNLFIELSQNPHFMAANILYTNFELLDKHFSEWFHLNEKTLFLYDKLMGKYRSEVLYNHQTELQHFNLTRGNNLIFDEIWKYRTAVGRICETRPMSEITFPEEDLNWYFLAANPHKCVIEFMKKNRQNINWAVLSQNSSDAAAEFLLEERENIDWWNASSNTNEKITVLFNQHRVSLSEYRLSRNSCYDALQILLNTDCYSKICWWAFCRNPNDIAVNHIITIISENRDDKRVIWAALCENTNPRVMDILRNNKDRIIWSNFLRNPICFSYNYEMMRERCLTIKKEIEEIFLRPDNVMSMIERYRNGDEEDFEVISRLNM